MDLGGYSYITQLASQPANDCLIDYYTNHWERELKILHKFPFMEVIKLWLMKINYYFLKYWQLLNTQKLLGFMETGLSQNLVWAIKVLGTYLVDIDNIRFNFEFRCFKRWFNSLDKSFWILTITLINTENVCCFTCTFKPTKSQTLDKIILLLSMW